MWNKVLSIMGFFVLINTNCDAQINQILGVPEIDRKIVFEYLNQVVDNKDVKIVFDGIEVITNINGVKEIKTDSVSLGDFPKLDSIKSSIYGCSLSSDLVDVLRLNGKLGMIDSICLLHYNHSLNYLISTGNLDKQTLIHDELIKALVVDRIDSLLFLMKLNIIPKEVFLKQLGKDGVNVIFITMNPFLYSSDNYEKVLFIGGEVFDYERKYFRKNRIKSSPIAKQFDGINWIDLPKKIYFSYDLKLKKQEYSTDRFIYINQIW